MLTFPLVPPEKARPLWATLHARITFLVSTVMDDILEQGRRDALEHYFNRQIGTGSDERMVKAYLERKRRTA